jgi:histidine triad (HIT) family protein
MSSGSCPFCVLIATGGAQLVDIGPDSAVILDHAPVMKGHALVVPVKHIPDLLATDPEQITKHALAVRRVASAVISAFEAEGVLTLTNTRISQSVPHLHTHVIPRNRGDRLRGFLWPRIRYRDEGELADYAAKLRSALARGF